MAKLNEKITKAERLRLDERMCERINDIIDGIDNGNSNNYPYAIGQIRATLIHAKRRIDPLDIAEVF